MLFGEPHECWEIFETERTLVREIKENDLPALFALYEKKGAADYIEALYPYEEELEYTEEYINKIYAFYGYGMWVIIQKSTGKLMGRVGLEDRTSPETGRILELGYIIDPDLWRQGYGTEVCVPTIKYAFEELDEEAVSCLIHPENLASIAFIRTLGFSLKKEVHVEGKDYEWWERLREEKDLPSKKD